MVLLGDGYPHPSTREFASPLGPNAVSAATPFPALRYSHSFKDKNRRCSILRIGLLLASLERREIVDISCHAAVCFVVLWFHSLGALGPDELLRCKRINTDAKGRDGDRIR